MPQNPHQAQVAHKTDAPLPGEPGDAEFYVAGWLVQPSRLKFVSVDDEEVHVEPKVMAVLECLAAHSGKVVSREQLMASVWPDVIVTDSTLTRCVSELRRLLNDSASDPRIVETIRTRGYRLIASVDQVSVPINTSVREERQPRRLRGPHGKAFAVFCLFVLSIGLFVSDQWTGSSKVQSESNQAAVAQPEEALSEANDFVLIGEPVTALEAALILSDSSNVWDADSNTRSE